MPYEKRRQNLRKELKQPQESKRENERGRARSRLVEIKELIEGRKCFTINAARHALT